MAVRVYRNPSAYQAPTPARNQGAEPIRPGRRQPGSAARGAPGARGHVEDSFDDAHPDSHVAERQVKKDHRAGRRELEAARRQLKEMREDAFHEDD